MFSGCTLYKYNNDPEHVYDNSDKHFVSVILPNNCSEYYAMFNGSSILKELPTLTSKAGNLSYMYYNCVIHNNNVILPADYFNICKDTLSST